MLILLPDSPSIVPFRGRGRLQAVKRKMTLWFRHDDGGVYKWWRQWWWRISPFFLILLPDSPSVVPFRRRGGLQAVKRTMTLWFRLDEGGAYKWWWRWWWRHSPSVAPFRIRGILQTVKRKMTLWFRHDERGVYKWWWWRWWWRQPRHPPFFLILFPDSPSVAPF